MTQIKLIMTVLTLGLFLFPACVPKYYAPTGINVPLFQEKNEVSANLSLACTADLSGPQAQVGYAFANHFGVIANGTYLSGLTPDNSPRGYGYLLEAGTGYFATLGKNLVFETYIGAGTGKVVNKRTDNPFSIDLKKIYFQPNFGYTSNKVDIAFSPRIVLIKYPDLYDGKKYITDIYGYPILENNERLILNDFQEDHFLVFEPAITIRGGWKQTKVQLQAVYSFHKIPYSEKLNINGGFYFTLAP
ncbi:hypothetical protein [Adhaeribacter soli]|uniref:Uncharacterized protein n=1 Tax=Adhaeribacter soli TaxID=2607655 RepID=A0A5N1J544_9BACT|nr:hypothetical protein [Adhaeribacter soli]KAA9340199.1 hypothetical protein F0P94_07580 [Adhaeribacter soli]